MKKRCLISTLAMLLAVMLLGLSCGAAAEGAKIGMLSYLNMTEQENNTIGISMRGPLIEMLFLNGVMEGQGIQFTGDPPTFRHYDSLNALLMGLQAGEVNSAALPFYTVKYLLANNQGLVQKTEVHPEKATGLSFVALSGLSDGYSFLIKEGNTALRDELDAQITAMKKDGTLQKLIDEHIIKVSKGGAPVAIAFEKFEGSPIRVAVTGSLPPMDYVSPDGTFAGFNTAVLAEIGKRMKKNIELVQVDSIGRALALSEGRVDAVFWSRAVSENMEEGSGRDMLAAEGLPAPDPEKAARMQKRDMPEGTIITQPYFSDFPVMVALK